VPLLIILFLFERLLDGVAPIHEVVQLALHCVLVRQLVAHVELDEAIAQHRHRRRLVLLQLDCNRLTCVLPLARRRVQIPVRYHEIRILPLLDFCGTRLQVLCIVQLLLPEVQFEVLVLASEHHVVVKMLAFQALQAVVLLSND